MKNSRRVVEVRRIKLNVRINEAMTGFIYAEVPKISRTANE